MLEEEIYGENSPIWEADFTVPVSDGTQLGHQTGTEHISYYIGYANPARKSFSFLFWWCCFT